MSADLISNPVEWVAGLGLALIAWFARKNLADIEHRLTQKADKEHMQREVEGLKMELKESRDARDRDNERMERVNAERFNEFSSSMRDRMSSMERNVNENISSLRDDMTSKLDMMIKVMDQLRKE